ncbi:hypothetical protein G6L37_01265 [Agrobacterium rubi]|nr:hypothetical protein [Agrobacterium rubi]NTF24021.1 hypothetical protein [Agrobacterium rubi]
MQPADRVSDFNASVGMIPVLVPYDRQADYLYLDAIGASRQEALSQFMSHMRFDLTLSEIFHLEFVEAELHFGGDRPVTGDLLPCVLPVSAGQALPMGVSSSKEECCRILGILKHDPAHFTFVDAALKLTDRIVL